MAAAAPTIQDAAALTDAFYADDAQLQPPGAPAAKGKAAIREFWAAFLAAGCTDASLRTADVGVCGNLAWGTGDYKFTGAGGVPHVGKYLVVYRRETDGSYRAIADAFSDNA